MQSVGAFILASVAELATLAFVLGVAFVCAAPVAWF